jgi:filamentous hemagglutinin family protein
MSRLVRGNRSVAGGAMVLLLATVAVTIQAQVVLDGKFGASGALVGPNFSVTDTLGATRGNNLFHSFAQFNLKVGETATFTGPANIQNILSRVTGGNPSSINGTIRSDIVGANFFLINPSGVIFGPNAAVNVTGSFAATTADYLKLADGAQFLASLGADDSGLSTAPVSAFGFLGASSGSIAGQQAILKVSNGKAITLVGGDILLDGGAVQAPGGQLNLVSVQSAGEVPVNPTSLGTADFKAAFPQQGQINLQNTALLDASGPGGGRIVIRGGRLTVDDSKIASNTTGTTAGQGIDIAVVNDLDLINGGQITSLSTTGNGIGGNINLSAESIRMDGGGRVDQIGNPATQISTASGDPFLGGGTAKGGDIVIQTGSLELVNSAQISSAAGGAGNAGRIEITAESVRLEASPTAITQITGNTWFGGGTAGDIVIHAGTLDMLNGATILAASFGSGKAGIIDLNARSVNLLSGAIITAASFASGNGGNVQVTADSILIDGQDTLTGGPDLLTGIQAVTTSLFSPTPGGTIHITAGSLELEHNASLFTTSIGLGPGGNISVDAGSVTLGTGSSIRASGEAAGPAGKISIHANNNLLLSGNSTVSTSALQSSGGDILVDAGNEIQLTDSQITAQAGPGGGGNITLMAPSLIYLLNSALTAQAEGDGGNLTIDPVFFVMNNSALISKSSSANGGNITILSDYFFQSGSTIDASAPFGLPGTVSVSAPQVDLSGSLVGLPNELFDVSTLLRPDCGVRLAGDVSSFVVLGRGGLPVQPGGFVPSWMASPVNEAQ